MNGIRREFIMFERIVKTGLINFARNAWLSIAAIAVMVITLTIILFSFISNQAFTSTIKQITDKIEVSVYLKDSVTDKQRDDLINQLKNNSEVKSVEYVSKADVYKTYLENNKNNPALLTAISLTDNPLPATLHIKPKDPNKLNGVKSFLSQKDIKDLQSDETNYSGDRKEAIDRITKAATFLRQAGIVGIAVFTFISMLIIFNTIRMAIFNRRDEITIMRLLGANTFYIRGPFVVETILYGIFAAIISVILVNSIFAVGTKALDVTSAVLDINYINGYFANHFWSVLAAQLGLGIMIGAVSSIIATRRYLKFKTTK